MSSCLPLILLSSVPLAPHSGSSYSHLYDPYIERSPPLHHIQSSRIEKAPKDLVPRPRRFETYESITGSLDELTGSLMEQGVVENDHILPFLSSYLSKTKTCATSFACRSNSTSYSLRTTPLKQPIQFPRSHVTIESEGIQASRAPVLACPSPARPALLPSVRGKAAGRSILRRATPSANGFSSLDLQDLVTMGVPMHEKIKIESLRQTGRGQSATRL